MAGDGLERVARRDVDHGAADALNTAIALVALLGGTKEQTAVPVHPDVAVARAAEGSVEVYVPGRSGLNVDDTVIRRRLRQKIEFINEDGALQSKSTEAELQASWP